MRRASDTAMARKKGHKRTNHGALVGNFVNVILKLGCPLVGMIRHKPARNKERTQHFCLVKWAAQQRVDAVGQEVVLFKKVHA